MGSVFYASQLIVEKNFSALIQEEAIVLKTSRTDHLCVDV